MDKKFEDMTEDEIFKMMSGGIPLTPDEIEAVDAVNDARAARKQEALLKGLRKPE
jgi:hypothetical protein